MSDESVLLDTQGVIVLAREIIVPGRTIHVRDIRDVRIRQAGPTILDWCGLGLLLLLTGAALALAFLLDVQGILLVAFLCFIALVVVGTAIPLALSFRKKALFVLTPEDEIPVAFARAAAALEPLCQAIQSLVGLSGGPDAVPRWGTALQDAANQTGHPNAEPPR